MESGKTKADAKRAQAANARAGKTDRLGTERMGRLLLEFSIPAIVSMVFNTLYNVVDTVFLGQAVGEVGVAVTTVAMPVMTILMGFSMLAGQGGNALAAIQLGRGEKAAVEKTLGNAALMLIGLAAAVAVAALVFIDPLLALVGASGEVYEPSKTFVQIVCCGFAFQSLGMGLNNFLRTAGKPNLSLAATVVGTVMCIVFNYLFVMVAGFGIAGSAWATICGQAFGMVPVVWYFVLSKTAPFRLRLSCMKPDARLMGQIASLGLASFVMQVATTVVSIVLNHVLTLCGAQSTVGVAGALAAVGVAQKAVSFAITPLIGLNMGAQPIIGYNYGAQSWARVLSCFKWGTAWAVAIATAFFVIAHVLSVPLVALFGVTGELESFAVDALRIYTLVFPLVGLQIFGSSYFQSSGQPVKAAILELTRQVIFLIPLYLLLPPALEQLLGVPGLTGVLVAVPASDALSVVVTAVFVMVEIRSLRARLRGSGGTGGAKRATIDSSGEEREARWETAGATTR